MVIAPDRALPVVAATLYCTVPLPVPLAPAVTVIQETVLAAVHAHPAAVVTATLPVAPAAGGDAVAGAIAIAQPLAWLTVKVFPATVSVPDRGPPVVEA